MYTLKEVFKMFFSLEGAQGSENVPWQLNLHFAAGPQPCELSGVSRRYKADEQREFGMVMSFLFWHWGASDFCLEKDIVVVFLKRSQ